MKIGIMGGTFDPIHNGHLMLGRYARDLYNLDEVWFMPNGNPPHKDSLFFETFLKHRIEMVKRAIANEPGFVLQLYEAENKKKNYSYLTMEYFNQKYPEHEFFFIIGADSLFSLEQWACPERLIKTCVILAAYRDDKSKHEMEEQILFLNHKYDGRIQLLCTPNMDISSREIRQKIKNNISIDNMVPEIVSQYIFEKQLYTNKPSIIKEKLFGMQNDKRYNHTIGVTNTAIELAERYDEELFDAQIAALLHDCAKCYSDNEQIRLCNKYGIAISDSEKNNPSLLHAKLGAYLAENEYEIHSKRILDAIRWHTTGRPKMTKLDKIIYIADYIEPSRNKAPNLAKIREIALVNLDECLYEILKATLKYLNGCGEIIDPMTEETYLYYKQILKKE